MKWWRAWLRRDRSFSSGRSRDAAMDEEMRFHIDMEAERLALLAALGPARRACVSRPAKRCGRRKFT